MEWHKIISLDKMKLTVDELVTNNRIILPDFTLIRFEWFQLIFGCCEIILLRVLVSCTELLSQWFFLVENCHNSPNLFMVLVGPRIFHIIKWLFVFYLLFTRVHTHTCVCVCVCNLFFNATWLEAIQMNYSSAFEHTELFFLLFLSSVY